MGISMFDPRNDAVFFRPVTISNQMRQSDSSCVDVPVLIIGGGPAGLLQAYLLSKLGGKCFALGSCIATDPV